MVRVYLQRRVQTQLPHSSISQPCSTSSAVDHLSTYICPPRTCFAALPPLCLRSRNQLAHYLRHTTQRVEEAGALRGTCDVQMDGSRTVFSLVRCAHAPNSIHRPMHVSFRCVRAFYPAKSESMRTLDPTSSTTTFLLLLATPSDP
jgi:hypothetical protein